MEIRRNAGIDFRLVSTDAHRMETNSLRPTHHVPRDPALAACNRRAVMATLRDSSGRSGRSLWNVAYTLDQRHSPKCTPYSGLRKGQPFRNPRISASQLLVLAEMPKC